MTIQYLYMIDGVSVPKHIYERRKLWGEHSARFWVTEKNIQQPQVDRRRS